MLKIDNPTENGKTFYRQIQELVVTIRRFLRMWRKVKFSGQKKVDNDEKWVYDVDGFVFTHRNW